MYHFVVFALIVISAEALVTIEQGSLNGTYLRTRNGKLFNSFYGIPYAEPPIGELRFKSPVEPKPWSGVWNASEAPSACIQVKTNSKEVIGSEDCLYMNIYTPLDAREGSNLSVIVFVHGGLVEFSSNMVDGPNYLLEHDVILVVPGYRKGVFGFLSTGDITITGNFGLKDQLLALQWVRKNIRHFGGDPNKVTLHGHGLGADYVHLHTLSPSSKGLFQKVIIQSGNAFSSSALFGPDVANAIANEFAKKIGCIGVNSSIEIYNCLGNINAEVMALVQQSMYIWDLDPDTIFRPTIEPTHSQAFLTDFPSRMKYHSPQLPWIIGMTTGEGAFKVARYLDKDGVRVSEIDENYKLLLPITLQYLWNTEVQHLNHISQLIRTHYFADQRIGEETSVEMITMYTEGLFGIGVIDTILSYPGPKYVYLYDYVSNYSTQNVIGYYEEYLGVNHGDEIHLLFCRNESAALLSEQDVVFSEELIKRWINFVDSGNPNTPQMINANVMSVWEPMTSKRVEYLLINLNGTMQTELYKGTYQFWKSLPIGSKYSK